MTIERSQKHRTRRVRVQGARVTKVVEFLKMGQGVWVNLSPQAIASLIDVVRGKVELADAHIGVLRLFEEAAPLVGSDSQPSDEIAQAKS